MDVALEDVEQQDGLRCRQLCQMKTSVQSVTPWHANGPHRVSSGKGGTAQGTARHEGQRKGKGSAKATGANARAVRRKRGLGCEG